MIPYNTDAPLYHLPIATVGLIVINTILFFAVPSRMLEPHPGRPPVGNVAAIEMANPVEKPWKPDAFRVVDEEGPVDDDNNAENQIADAESTSLPWHIPDVGLALEHGAGLKPWQWLTGIFMHADFLHLLLNMIALWAFGLVVEGKVGAFSFLVIYLGIGVFQSGLEQLLMLTSQPGVSLGASAAIFGILGVALVWAPRNEFDVLWSFGFRAGTIEVPILIFAFVQFCLEAIGVVSNRFGISSSLLHLMGFAAGVVVGLVWLQRRWVDCEGWDLLNVWRGRETKVDVDEQLEAEARQLIQSTKLGRTAGKPQAASPAPPASNESQRRVGRGPADRRTSKRAAQPTPASHSPTGQASTSLRALQDVEHLIAAGNLSTAMKLFAKLQVGPQPPQLSQPVLLRLVRGLLEAKQYTDAIPLMREHIERFSENRLALQLNLAKLLLHLQQPRKAIAVLKVLREGRMDQATQATWKLLAAHAQHQIDDGVVEISD